jgi:hypothetical protein
LRLRTLTVRYLLLFLAAVRAPCCHPCGRSCEIGTKPGLSHFCWRGQYLRPVTERQLKEKAEAAAALIAADGPIG